MYLLQGLQGEARRLLIGVYSLLAPLEYQGSSLSSQIWQKYIPLSRHLTALHFFVCFIFKMKYEICIHRYTLSYIYLFLNIYLSNVYVLVPTCLYVQDRLSGSHINQKRVSDILGLEFQSAAMWVLGNKPNPSARSANVPSCWPISLRPIVFIFKVNIPVSKVAEVQRNVPRTEGKVKPRG